MTLDLAGYREEHADLVAQVWRGGLLLSAGPAGLYAPGPPRPDEWCRVLIAPGAGVAVLDDIDYVHRTTRLSVAALTDPAGLLDRAIAAVRDRLRLRRVFGVLPDTDAEAAEIVAAQGFTAEVTVPEHVWHDGAARAGTIWGRCFDVD
ncbi:hypothetical protein SAMN05421504_101764 [Amycolatopsis xylanica]|uniref:Uncharacterized protein n=1 Tax=Amycolatopsis xylanica TaxID=589385 RepID=A0A1H2U2A2_9PSEU|nr:hypothetical protein [Amycolatopsis xylanica]SDW50345.1 hypothetical protein SAMN05421504_101764 [Amycolatopsis xylanica]